MLAEAGARPIVIVPSGRWVTPQLGHLWEYRELLYFLVWRDLKVRYKQTVLGAGWAILQPFLTMVVFSVFFGRLAGIPSDGLPYPIFAYCALVPWHLFLHGLSESGTSLVGNQNLLTKVYFPRLLIPVAAVVTGLVDFAIAFVVLLGMMGFYGVVPTRAIVYLPLFVVLALGAALGVGLWLCSLNVRYRDVRYAIPFVGQFWLFATPVAYPASLVPDTWRTWLGLNPMAGVVEGFRWSLLGTGHMAGPMLGVSVTVVLVLLTGGILYFARMERTFADVL